MIKYSRLSKKYIINKSFTNNLNNNIIFINKKPIIYNEYVNSFTVEAICSLIEYNIPNFKCSRLFLYYNEKILSNNYSPNDQFGWPYCLQWFVDQWWQWQSVLHFFFVWFGWHLLPLAPD